MSCGNFYSAGQVKVKKLVGAFDFYSGSKKRVTIFLNQSPRYLIIKNADKHFLPASADDELLFVLNAVHFLFV